MGIKLGQALGANRPDLAKFTATTGITLTVCILAGLGTIVYSIPRQLGSIFSSDDQVLDLFVDIRIPLAFTMVVMNLSVFLEKIPISMGRTRDVLILGLIGSWGGQVPAVLLLVRFWREDLVAVYTGIALGYGLLVILYLVLVLRSDWEAYAREALERAEMKQHDHPDDGGDKDEAKA